MRLIGKLGYSLAALIPALALAACSSQAASTSGTPGAASGPPPEVRTITMDVVTTLGAAGVYVAQDYGYFARQGLTVKIVPINNGEVGEADLQSGKAQLVEGNDVSFVLAQSAGSFAAPVPGDPTRHQPAKPINLRIIADSARMQPGNEQLYVAAHSPYKTVGDLVKAHAKVGNVSVNNIGSLLVGSLLAADGYQPDAVTEVPELLPKMPALLASGAIAAAWMPEPTGTLAQQQYGAVPLADLDQGSMQDFPIGAVAGSTSWVQSHPNTVAAFLRGYNQGQQAADVNRTAVEQAMLKYKVAASSQVAAAMTINTYPVSISAPVLQRVPDAMYQFGIIHKPFKISSMIQAGQAGQAGSG
jgi:NitT/TauT family transport system substrate-binding protein